MTNCTSILTWYWREETVKKETRLCFYCLTRCTHRHLWISPAEPQTLPQKIWMTIVIIVQNTVSFHFCYPQGYNFLNSTFLFIFHAHRYRPRGIILELPWAENEGVQGLEQTKRGEHRPQSCPEELRNLQKGSSSTFGCFDPFTHPNLHPKWFPKEVTTIL